MNKRFDQHKTYTRHLPDTEDMRACTVQVMPYDCPFGEFTHKVVESHECFTGFEWISMCNVDYTHSFEGACESAKGMVREFS